MSWDVMIFNIPGASPPPVEQLDEGDCKPLGSASEVRQQISTLLPGVDWSDPTWGIYLQDGFSIEFNVGKDDPIGSMMLHVRGGGDAISAITKFARPPGWSVLDCSTGAFLDLESPSPAGWEAFQAFRDQVIGVNQPGIPITYQTTPFPSQARAWSVSTQQRLLTGLGVAVVAGIAGAVVALSVKPDQLVGIVIVTSLIGFVLGLAFKFRVV
jgi:hypothetical protein